jgi:hypothetical protein
MREVREAISDSVATTSSSGEQMVRQPKRIESPFLGALRDLRNRLRRGHPQTEQTEPNTDFYLLHAIIPR